jgi:hypothetical protein
MSVLIGISTPKYPASEVAYELAAVQNELQRQSACTGNFNQFGPCYMSEHRFFVQQRVVGPEAKV